MSNHSGSYIINEVLSLLEKKEFFAGLNPSELQQFFSEISEIGRYYNCNDGEIFEGISEKFGICYCCMKFSDSLEDGRCFSCR